MTNERGGIAAALLRRWRIRTGLSVAGAADRLDISERMLAYYESGRHPVPRTVELAAQALDAGMVPASEEIQRADARRRWVRLVEVMRAYGRGEPVVGQMMKALDHEGLSDFLAFVRRGPDPRLAMTDPALFKTLRTACTKAQLSGLGNATLNERQWSRVRAKVAERELSEPAAEPLSHAGDENAPAMRM